MTDPISRPVISQLVTGQSAKIDPPLAPATSQPSEAKPIAPIPKRTVERASFPDLTGLYESVPERAGLHSAVMLQLNQVGKIIVGWFVPPPMWMPNRSDTKSRSPQENRFMMPPGVLYGEISKPLTQGLFQFFWTRANIQINKPEDLLENFTLDPHEILTDTRSTGLEGALKPVVLGGELDSIYLVFNVERINNTDIVTSPNAERFVRIKAIPRVSNYHLHFLPKQIQEALLVEQICPLPTSFVDAARGKLAPFDDPASIPPVAILIKEWREASNNATKEVKRILIHNVVYSALLDNHASRAYLTVYQNKLRAHISSFTLVVGSEKKTYLEWYQAVLGEEMDEIKSKNLGKNLNSPSSPLIEDFNRAGITSTGEFAYTLTFNPISTPDLQKYIGLPISLSFTGFLVTIKKELLIYEETVLKKVKLVDGKPVVKQRTLLPWDSKNSIMGIYFEAGIAFSFNRDVLNRTSGGVKTTHKGKLSPIELRSNISIVSPKEFENANFFMGACRAPSAAVGNFVSLDSFNSIFVEMHLKNNIVLSTVDEESFKYIPPKLPGLDKAFKPKEYIEGWTQAKWGVRLFDGSGGWGFLLGLPGNVSLTDRHQNFEPREKKVEEYTLALLEDFFKVDSADLDQLDSRDISPRTVLEALLAKERALFSSERAQITVKGYTSPEGSEEHNLKLSILRANAVMQGIKDAFNPTLKLSNIDAFGLGEDLSDKSLVPPEPHLIWASQHPEQVAKWPKLRRVVVEIRGYIIARLQDR